MKDSRLIGVMVETPSRKMKRKSVISYGQPELG